MSAFIVPGYSCFRTDRANDVKGGDVGIWLQRSFQGEVVPIPCNDNVEICIVKLAKNKLCLWNLFTSWITNVCLL